MEGKNKRWLSRAALLALAIGASASWLPAMIPFAAFCIIGLIALAFCTAWSFAEPKEFVKAVKPRPVRSETELVIMHVTDVCIWLMLAFTGHWVLSTMWFIMYVLGNVMNHQRDKLHAQ